jgi:hypothetical protein
MNTSLVKEWCQVVVADLGGHDGGLDIRKLGRRELALPLAR